MIVGTLIESFASIFHMVLNLYIWVVIIGALLTWVRPDPYNQFVQIIYKLTEPVYTLTRKYIPTVFGGIDLAPLIIVIALQFMDIFIYNLLMKIAHSIAI